MFHARSTRDPSLHRAGDWTAHTPFLRHQRVACGRKTGWSCATSEFVAEKARELVGGQVVSETEGQRIRRGDGVTEYTAWIISTVFPDSYVPPRVVIMVYYYFFFGLLAAAATARFKHPLRGVMGSGALFHFVMASLPAHHCTNRVVCPA